MASANVRVNAIAPGLIETEILEGVSEQALERIIEQTPMKRIGQPEEVAAMVAFLCSAAADEIRGAALPVDGAWTAR